jgi:hypothetical protein
MCKIHLFTKFEKSFITVSGATYRKLVSNKKSKVVVIQKAANKSDKSSVKSSENMDNRASLESLVT